MSARLLARCESIPGLLWIPFLTMSKFTVVQKENVSKILCGFGASLAPWVSNMIGYQWKTDDSVRIVDHFYTKIYLSVHLQSTTYHIGVRRYLFPPFVYHYIFFERGVFIDNGLARFGCDTLTYALIHRFEFSHTNFSYVVVIWFAMDFVIFIMFSSLLEPPFSVSIAYFVFFFHFFLGICN